MCKKQNTCVAINSLFLCFTVIQEVSPHVIITSAKQERSMTLFLQQLGELWEMILILPRKKENRKTF